MPPLSLLATPPIPQLCRSREPLQLPTPLATLTPPALLLLASRQTLTSLPSATLTLLIPKPKPLTLVPVPELLPVSQQSPLAVLLMLQACCSKPELAIFYSVPPIQPSAHPP